MRIIEKNNSQAMCQLKIADIVKDQINNPCPDINRLIDVINGKKAPTKVHLGEIIIRNDIIAWFTKNVFQKNWVDIPSDGNMEQMKAHLLCLIEYWYRMGYDYIRLSGGLVFKLKSIENDGSWTNRHSGLISNWQEFEKYPWPNVKDQDLWHYEFVSDNLPESMGMMVCPTGGFLEMPMNYLFGIENLSLLMYDNPELVQEVFIKVRNAILTVYEKLIDIPKVVGFFQGDDMGFKSATMYPPDFLKLFSLPGHKKAAEMAHSNGKIYILHSCGNLYEIMDYLIDEIEIDAKHSFEDVITPVEEIYSLYSDRVAVIGGIDVALLSDGTIDDVKKRIKKILKHCFPGRYLLGSGNCLADYSKPENVLAMYEEAYKWSR